MIPAVEYIINSVMLNKPQVICERGDSFVVTYLATADQKVSPLGFCAELWTFRLNLIVFMLDHY